MNNIIFVGLDVHKEKIAIAYAKGKNRGVESLGIIIAKRVFLEQPPRSPKATGADF